MLYTILNQDYLSYLLILDILRSRLESKPLVAFIIVHSRYTVDSFIVFIRKCSIPNKENVFLVDKFITSAFFILLN